MQTRSEAYARGVASGKMALELDLLAQIESDIEGMHSAYPLTAELDILQEVYRLDCERVANPPDSYKYPETKGLADLVWEERRGFQDTTGCSDMQMAFHYSSYYYYSRRINTRYIGTRQPMAECSAAFLPNSTEGGPLYGRNWDILLNEWARRLMEPPREAADGSRVLWTKGVSCSVMLDDEPDEIFPVDPFELMPADCTGSARAAAEFLYRYRDFWGPTNCIVVDTNHDSVAIEKANVRMGIRPSVNGASAVTALAFLDPEMKAFKLDRDKASIARRGWTLDEAPDWKYWRGCDQRYERLVSLVNAASERPASLQDMADIMTDHAVPYPARVCIAGQSCIEGFGPDQTEWTGVSHSEVLEGPNRRILFYTVEDNKPCYDTPPYLVLGEGVEMKPEWQANARPLPAVAKTPRPRVHMEYPNVRMML
jgi:hypothetical protein